MKVFAYVLCLAPLALACGGDDGTAPSTDVVAAPDGAATGGGDLWPLIVETCSFTNACSFGPEVNAPIDRCVSRMIDFFVFRGAAMEPVVVDTYERLIACAAGASTCDEFTACGRAGASRSCPAPNTFTCVGDTAYYCQHRGSNIGEVKECAKHGMSCVDGQCVTDRSCDDPDGPPRCDGAAITSCGNDLLVRRWSCGAGRTCFEDGMGGVACVPDGNGCSGPQVPTCEGTRITGCAELPDVVGAFARVDFDCAELGMVCDPSAGCVFPDPDCDPNATTGISNGACVGDEIHACAAGRSVAIRCEDYGLPTCGVVTQFPICRPGS